MQLKKIKAPQNGRYRLLDLCCGAGGAGMGYAKAGFDVTGIDIAPQPSYPYAFIQADALQWLREHRELARTFDVIHASPPCQSYSVTKHFCKNQGKHPDLMAEFRAELEAIGRPYVIENVPRAPMRCDLKLFGYMFGLPVIRERWFELHPWLIMQPIATRPRGTARNGDFVTVAGNGHTYNCVQGKNGPEAAKLRRIKCWRGSVVETWRHAMDMPWANTRKEIAQAIPPPYTHFIGKEIMSMLDKENNVSGTLLQVPSGWRFEKGTPWRGPFPLLKAIDGRSEYYYRIGAGMVTRIKPESLADERVEWQPISADVAIGLLQLPFLNCTIPANAQSKPRTRPSIQASCRHCGTLFGQSNPKQEFCGGACRVAAHRKKKTDPTTQTNTQHVTT